MAEKTIFVVPGPAADGKRVGLWEPNPAHPNGEIYVAADAGSTEPPKPVEVAETAAVLQALRDERIVKVDGPRASAAEEPKPLKAKE